MMSVIDLPMTPATVDALWERYRDLAIAVSCDPDLTSNRAHMEELVRAEMAWKAAFLALE